ncbi:MAG TPA: vitamin K epoxide reductase family protein [Thermoanaerobaculia bacterium]|nr:vitamin K epoxide reductase family protein [Thermoanaerobaculia bacterium]
MDAEELSRELRNASAPELRRRRQIVGLSMLASASMAVITLYQTGIIKHLPEPPLPFLDADKVDASAEAYGKFNTPDAALGLASYAVTTILASMGGKKRASWIVLALAAKLGFDAANALKLTIDQPLKHRAFCFWCLIAATATFASVPLIVPEARQALRAAR